MCQLSNYVNAVVAVALVVAAIVASYGKALSCSSNSQLAPLAMAKTPTTATATATATTTTTGGRQNMQESALQTRPDQLRLRLRLLAMQSACFEHIYLIAAALWIFITNQLKHH